jgi:hypothetical protein
MLKVNVTLTFDLVTPKTIGLIEPTCAKIYTTTSSKKEDIKIKNNPLRNVLTFIFMQNMTKLT